MSPRGNDAIPTWSGFNYQGKVMLLYVLQLINSLPANEISSYQVELEAREDFIIVKNGMPQSLHQVKAYLSTDKWISYSEAMDKLISHRNNSGNPVAKCFLMVAKEISDWTDSSNSYKAAVYLYKYSGQVVGITDVKNLLNTEIDKYLKKIAADTSKQEIVYGSLCIFLEDEIAKMHRQGIKKRVYTINFEGIIKNIETSLKASTIREEYHLKERVFDYVVEQIKRACEKCCVNSCTGAFNSCVSPCAAKEAYGNILILNDLVKYCKIIVPNRKDGWDDPLTLTSCINEENMYQNVFLVFKESNTPSLVTGNNNAVSLRSKFCTAKNQTIIPTLLDLSTDYLSRNRNYSLQETLQDIKDNIEILEDLDGNAITAVPGNYSGQFTQAQITSSWAQIEKNTIGEIYKGIEIISQKELLDKFKDNGGNCE